ncbi:hypothetical protein BH18CHL2_BH18CHL2_02960 [soil metagenome]
MDKSAVLRASTPGGHPLVTLAWLVALALLAATPWLDTWALGTALGLGTLAVYLLRHLRFVRRLGAIETALRSGDLERARDLAAPLLSRFPDVALVQKAAADVLYAAGEPLSAASLYERAAKRIRGDREIVVGLVASYAALNKAGDARRAAALAPHEFDVRLALTWSELVALAGDRPRGAVLASALLADLDVTHGAERTAMTNALAAVAAAERRDGVGARAALEAAERQQPALEPADRAFIGYLGGIALRELGLVEDARATFELAMAAAPGTIGEALARRERSHLPGSPSPSPQPSAD